MTNEPGCGGRGYNPFSRTTLLVVLLVLAGLTAVIYFFFPEVWHQLIAGRYQRTPFVKTP